MNCPGMTHIKPSLNPEGVVAHSPGFDELAREPWDRHRKRSNPSDCGSTIEVDDPLGTKPNATLQA